MNPLFIMESIEESAAETETLLSILASRRRLIILCNLMASGEIPVGELMKRLDLAQSALSQHLALMRAAGIVSTRREGTTIYYSLTDTRTKKLLTAIMTILCPEMVPSLSKAEAA
ncbi:MAG: ArsR family transcriptional [Beijerinckiaceae bacterium]|nr:MAG: ArsR family transcriptional [Beijerinckiaceae bacterium]